MRYAQHLSKKTDVPATVKISGTKKNSGGGYSFKVDSFTHLERFLILGCEGGSYYAGERKLTKSAAKSIEKCLSLDFERTISMIVDISQQGRCIRNETCEFALAVACSSKNPAIAKHACNQISLVCRTGGQLISFVSCVREAKLRGWGKVFKEGVANWYLNKPVKDLAFQMVKYQNRDGWRQRDILRLAHPKTDDRARNSIFSYVCDKKNWKQQTQLFDEPTRILALADQVKYASPKEAARLIVENNLPWECLLTEQLKCKEIWEGLIEVAPPRALISNLGRMSALGMLTPGSNAQMRICSRLEDAAWIKRSRLHPLTIANTKAVFQGGRAIKGNLRWTSNTAICDALESAFYNSFGNVESSGKRIMLALDVSASMCGGKIGGSVFNPREASGLLAMTMLRSEPNCFTTAFTCGFVPLNLSRHMSQNEVLRAISNLPFMHTDCSIPMVYAQKKKLPVDLFVIVTDSETNAGVHPTLALQSYRETMGINAKMAVVSMIANKFSIADPNDPGQLDMVGFDLMGPEILSKFASL